MKAAFSFLCSHPRYHRILTKHDARQTPHVLKPSEGQILLDAAQVMMIASDSRLFSNQLNHTFMARALVASGRDEDHAQIAELKRRAGNNVKPLSALAKLSSRTSVHADVRYRARRVLCRYMYACSGVWWHDTV